MKIAGRIIQPLTGGVALIGSDAHYWSNKRTTAHRAFVKFIQDYKPKVIILNGDVIDGATISRHPPIGWEKFPTVEEEIVAAQEMLKEIEKAARDDAKLIWTLGNHDARFNTRLAMVAKEYRGVFGTKLYDHFQAWKPAWSVELGGKHGAIVKHSFSGGSGAALNNAVKSGRSIVTGHLHRLGVRAFNDYSGTRWGVESGMLADSAGPQFQGYTQNNPLDWQSGFVMLTFDPSGRMRWPEVVNVVKPGWVEFRGLYIHV